MESNLQHIMDRVTIDQNGCWNWNLAKNESGYGMLFLRREGYRGLAHRWAYRVLREPIPESMHIDHLCRNRACVNPDHLEPVTPLENARRGVMSRIGRNYSVYQRASDASWVAAVTVSVTPRRRRVFLSLDRDAVIAKMETWLASSGASL